jgi:hypothetical protein
MSYLLFVAYFLMVSLMHVMCIVSYLNKLKSFYELSPLCCLLSHGFFVKNISLIQIVHKKQVYLQKCDQLESK